MNQHKPFRISDFSLKDIPVSILGYLVLSLFSVGFGVWMDALPEFWSGILLGAGVAMFASVLLFNLLIMAGPSTQKVDIAAFPPPSDAVRAMCDDPGCSFIEAVKAYRDETGVGLSEAVAVLRDDQNRNQKGSKDASNGPN